MTEGPLDMKNMVQRRSTLLGLAGLGGFSILLVLLLNALSIDAFTLPGDNLVYFLPLIQAHARELLHGHVLDMAWGVGAGWSPFESAAVGLFYPLNHLSLLLAGLLGNSQLLLEVSATLHLYLAGAVTYTLLPKRLPAGTRFLLALLMVIQPAPILLGRNWHVYLAGYPWFMALALTVWRSLDGEITRLGRQASWLGFGLLLFLATHPQVYIFSILILMAWLLAESPNRRGLALLLELGFAQLPTAVPLIYIKHLSAQASLNMMAGRGEGQLVLAFAQSTWTTLQGMLIGNLGGGGGFQLWSGVSGLGIGLFFCPAWFLALYFTVKQRKWRLSILLVLGAMTLGIASFPWLRHLFVGPLAGFRWTWKLTMLLCPLALLLAIRHWDDGFAPGRFRWYLGLGQGLAALLVLCLGQSFDLLPSASAAYTCGVEGLLRETRACLMGAGLPPGTRVAVVGGSGMADPLPLPLLGLMGAAPLLSGYETPCSYEPLEPAKVADLHYGLSVPWRISVPAQAYHDDPPGMEAKLRLIGVQGLVTRFPDLFPPQGTSAYEDSVHRVTYIRTIAPPVPGAYPFVLFGQTPTPLLRGAGGRLETPAGQGTEPPTLVPDRPLKWSRLPDGRWMGRPMGPGWGWILTGSALAGVALLGLSRLPDALRP